MTVLLTDTGWTDLLGNDNTWTDFADFVYGSTTNETAAVGVEGGEVASTLGGADYISGVALGTGLGIAVVGELQTNQGADLIIGYSVGGDAGIFVSGTIGTGQGSDKIIGQGLAGDGLVVTSEGSILTRAGDDVIIGNSLDGTGIVNEGTITLDDSGIDQGIDVMQGAGGNGGINNSGSITFGGGNDTLAAVSTGTAADITNSGEIRMGAGADSVIFAGTGVGLGGGTYFLGAGGDTFAGFAAGGTVDAGDGVEDTLILTSEVADNSVSYTVNLVEDTVTFTATLPLIGGVTMTTSNFENLVYGEQTFAFSDLTDGQVIGAVA